VGVSNAFDELEKLCRWTIEYGIDDSLISVSWQFIQQTLGSYDNAS